MNNTRLHKTGFTLIEVMVALAVVSIGLLALVKVSGQYASNTHNLKNLTIASWVAENIATEYQLKSEFPATGSRTGDSLMANHSWRWRVKITNTPDKNLRRLDIAVTQADGDLNNPLYNLVSFKARP